MKNSRKVNWMALLLVMSIILGFAGCKGDGVRNASVEGTVSKGGIVKELKIGTTKPNDVFSSMSESGAFGNMNYNAFTQATFTDLDENTRVKPNFMQSWEISPDCKELVFTFPKDVYWHDGKPVTAEDVKFTFEYLRDIKKSSYITRFNLTKVEILEQNKMRLTFADPAAFSFLNRISFVVYMYPKHIWENVKDPAAYTGKDAVVGCGPYKFVSYDSDSQTSFYEAVDNYYKGEITVKKVSIRSFDNQEALVMALKNGQIDAMYDYGNPLDATMAPSITNVANVNPGMSFNTGSFFMSFGFNRTPSDNLQFRQAVSYTLNYQLLAQAIGGEFGEIPGKGIIASPNKGFDKSIPKLEQNVDQAKKLLNDAGFIDRDGDGFRELPDGKPMDVLITPSNNSARQQLFLRISEIVGENLKNVGVKSHIDMESVRNVDFFKKRTQTVQDYEIFIHFSTPGSARFDTIATYFVPKPPTGWGTFKNTEYKNSYDKMNFSTSYEEYEKNVKDLQKMHVEHIPGIALCWDKAFFPYRTDKYEGWINYPAWGVINNQTWYTLRTK